MTKAYFLSGYHMKGQIIELKQFQYLLTRVAKSGCDLYAIVTD